MSRFLIAIGIAAVLLAPGSAIATTYGVQVEFMANGVHDRVGNLLVGGRVYSYTAGSMTPKSLYLDRALTTAAANPVILDGEGKANVFASGYYKFIVKDSDLVTIRTMDNFAYTDISTVFTGLYNTAAAALTFGYDATRKVAVTTTIAGATTAVADGTVALKTYAPDSAAQFFLRTANKTLSLLMHDTTGMLTITPPGVLDWIASSAPQFTLTAGSNSLTIGLDGDGLFQIDMEGTTSSGYQIQVKDGSNQVATGYDADGDLIVASTGTIEVTTPISADNFVLPAMDIASSSAFTFAANWRPEFQSTRWTRVGDSTRGGFVSMAGYVTCTADSASLIIGTIGDTTFKPARAHYGVTMATVAYSQGSHSCHPAIVTVDTSGEVSLVWEHGSTGVFVGDTVFMNGLSYPLR